MDSRNEFVLDGSVTLVWAFEDEDDTDALAILDRMPELHAHVPSLWPLEVANALLVGERRGRTTVANVTRFLEILGRFSIVVDEETIAQAWAKTIDLARAHNLSAYDAAYLELAMRRSLPLATLVAAAKAVGVPLLGIT